MRKRFTALGVVVWLGALMAPAYTQEPAPEWKIPPEEAKKENPVKPSDTSLADGKRTYKIDCEMCHGATGDGKTELADSMQLKLRDLRDPATLKDYTDGGLAYLIVKGKGKMLGEEGRLKGTQVWNVVNYVRSLVKKEDASAPAKKEEGAKEEAKREEKPPQ